MELTLLYWVGGIAVIIFAVLSCLSFRPNKHRRNIKKAKRALDVMRCIHEPQRKFGYLRKVDPFVFEEMILTSFSDLDFKIKRNKRYTGDGGIDGRVTISGNVVLVQAKRYKTHINPQHVEEFSKVCKINSCLGIFIHTGKTGNKSRTVDFGLDIVSGDRMIQLLSGNYYKPRFKTLK